MTKYFTAADVLRMADSTGRGQTRSNFNVSLKPKLDELGIGQRFGNKRTPIFYTRNMARDILTWILYRSWLEERERIGKRAPFTADDILGILKLADALRTAGNRDNTAMNFAMDTAEQLLNKEDK